MALTSHWSIFRPMSTFVDLDPADPDNREAIPANNSGYFTPFSGLITFLRAIIPTEVDNFHLAPPHPVVPPDPNLSLSVPMGYPFPPDPGDPEDFNFSPQFHDVVFLY